MNTSTSESPHLQPASSVGRTVGVPGLRLHYLDFDTTPEHQSLTPRDDPRPKMVFIHGGAANAHWFDFVAGAFSTRYRVLSLDLRGHGDSEWASEPDYSYVQYAAPHDDNQERRLWRSKRPIVREALATRS